MKKKNIHSDNGVAYAMIAPYYIFLFLFILLPIVVNIFMSFTNYDLRTMDFIGFRNYERMLSDSFLAISIRNTFVYTIISLSILLVLGLATAILITKVAKRLAGFFRTCIFIPFVVSMASASMIWLWMYDPGAGFLNAILGWFNIPNQTWVYDVDMAMGSVIAVTVWKFLGYNMVIYTAGLLGIPAQLYEAAKIDGAGAIKQLYYITLPMLWPTTFFLLVTGFTNNFNVFEQINILTQGGPMNATTTIMHQVYRRAFIESRFGYAAAITVVLLVIVSIVTALSFRLGSRGQDLDLS